MKCDKQNCDNEAKYKDFRTDPNTNITSKYYVCEQCRHLPDFHFFKQKSTKEVKCKLTTCTNNAHSSFMGYCPYHENEYSQNISNLNENDKYDS